jgi:hypothetical protein
MQKYLFNHTKSKLGDNFTTLTHTRIGDKEFKIHCGSYCIQNKQEFLKLYYDEVIEHSTDEYLTEKQDKNGVIAIDLDFRYSHDIKTRQHDNDIMEDIIIRVTEPLKEFYNFEHDDQFDVFILEKPNVNVLEDGSLTKDGIHFIIGLNMKYDYRELYRQTIIKALEANIELPLLNTWDNVVDKGVLLCSNNWQMFGSKKPNNQKYNLTKAYKFKYDAHDKSFCWDDIPTIPMNYELFERLSVQNLDRPDIEMNPNLELNYEKKSKKCSSPKSVAEINTIDNTIDNNKEKELINILKLTTNQKKDRKVWLSICSFMINNNFKATDWENFCKTNELNWDSEKEGLFTNLKPFDIEIFYIQKIAKENNYDEYKLWLDKYKITNDTKMKVGNNDDAVANILFEELKDKLKSYKGRIFYLYNNIWIYDEKKIQDIILNYILNSGIHSYSPMLGFIPVSKSITNAKKFMETLFIKINVNNEDEKLYDKFHKSTEGKLCFNDGVLDFVNKKFMSWEEAIQAEIYSTVKINRDFKQYFDNPDQNVMDEITKQIFNTGYGDKTNLIFHFLSRAIAGHYEDKRFASYLGNRNSGKGVEYDLLKYGFGDYINTFELGNILYNRHTSGQENVDCSKKLYWLIDLEFVRLAINQESPDSSSGLKVNSKLWKKMTGGGDTIVARRNYDRKDTYFKMDTTFYVKGNNSLVFDNEDCTETGVEFDSVIQFKTLNEINYMKYENILKINAMINDNIDSDIIEKEKQLMDIEMVRYRVADDTIKDKCKSEEWSNAIVMLLYNNYVGYKIPINKRMNIESNNLVSSIKEMFDITHNIDDDITLCTEVYTILSTYDKKKIDLELNTINVLKKKCKKSGSIRDKLCFFGLKPKVVQENV